jgi:hypothetical protein
MSKTKKIILTSDALPINYEGQKWLNWFVSDSQILQNLCSQVFRGGLTGTDQSFIDLLTAANSAVTELTEDITKLKEFLDSYVPTNNN